MSPAAIIEAYLLRHFREVGRGANLSQVARLLGRSQQRVYQWSTASANRSDTLLAMVRAANASGYPIELVCTPDGWECRGLRNIG